MIFHSDYTSLLNLSCLILLYALILLFSVILSLIYSINASRFTEWFVYYFQLYVSCKIYIYFFYCISVLHCKALYWFGLPLVIFMLFVLWTPLLHNHHWFYTCIFCGFVLFYFLPQRARSPWVGIVSPAGWPTEQGEAHFLIRTHYDFGAGDSLGLQADSPATPASDR